MKPFQSKWQNWKPIEQATLNSDFGTLGTSTRGHAQAPSASDRELFPRPIKAEKSCSFSNTLSEASAKNDRSGNIPISTVIGTFGTSVPRGVSKTKSFEILDSSSPFPGNDVRSLLQKWDCQLIWDSIHSGKLVRIWSRTLNEWIYWVYGETQKEEVARIYPETIVYTLDEIAALISQKVTQEGLRKLHEIKRILGGQLQPLKN
jgi:hypothetical protein